MNRLYIYIYISSTHWFQHFNVNQLHAKYRAIDFTFYPKDYKSRLQEK